MYNNVCSPSLEYGKTPSGQAINYCKPEINQFLSHAHQRQSQSTQKGENPSAQM